MLAFLIVFSIGMSAIMGGIATSGLANQRKWHRVGVSLIGVGVLILLALTLTI